MHKTHDVIVIGGWSGGYAAARIARDAYADVAIVDQGPLGGLCILRGCMPTKVILLGVLQLSETCGPLNFHRATIIFPQPARRSLVDTGPGHPDMVLSVVNLAQLGVAQAALFVTVRRPPPIPPPYYGGG